MAQNNIRIIYNNLIDGATLSASSTAGSLTVANLKTDQKGLVWRSVGTTATITAIWANSQTLNAVVLPFCNLSNTSTIRVRVFSDTAGTSVVLDTGTINAGAYTPQDVWGGFGTNYSGVAAYSFGGGSYGRAWFNTATGRRIDVTITDSANPQGYIELSRLVVGAYWSPTYNTSFGIQLGFLDTSEQVRTESGNLITQNGTVHKTMTFDLSWLIEKERVKMLSILRGNGLRKPLFVSVFPQDSSIEKEQNYQIYGKLNSLNDITHPIYTVYSTSISIEEI